MSSELEFLRELDAHASSGRAKHERLAASLMGAIESGYWPPGEKLPTEQELARISPYSLGTVQRAMRTLVDSGVVVRRQGAGSFVAEPKRVSGDSWPVRFYADDGETFLPILSKVIFRDRHSERGRWSRSLDLDSDAEVVQLDRHIAVGDEFSALSRLYLAANPYAGLLYRPLAELDDARFDRELREAFGVRIASVSLDSSCTRFADEICDVLSVQHGTDGLVIHAIAKDDVGMPVYYHESYIPPNGRRLHIADLKVASKL